jgi:serine/threonine-protein kinase
MTIVTYGILIPNTARRSIVAVVAMMIGFLAITLGLALTAVSTPPGAITGYLLCSITDMTFASAIAIFGAYRIETLQRAAAEARKLGPYRLRQRIGAGGMGEVYLAEHALLRRPCALKVIRREHTGDARLLARFEREVQAMATLAHPNTVRIYDYGLADDGTFYYAMEYLTGLSLDELVRRDGPLPPARVVFLLRQVCGALREAHFVGLVHRDIKPGNILICSSGGIHDMVKLLDFGLVRLLAADAPSGHALTELGTTAGTPAFMSPEQAAGAAAVDARTDIYSLGTVAYFLLTGRPPFIEATSVQTMAAHLTAEPVPPSRHQPNVPADVDEVIMRCLEKEPERRFQDIPAVEEALVRCACNGAWSSEQAAEWWQTVAVEPITPTL